MATSCKRKRAYPLLPNEGRRVIRLTTLADAGLYEQLGVWRRDYDTRTGALLGFRLVGAEVKKVDGDLRSMASCVSIGPREMEMQLMRSRTFGLREEARLQRIKKGLPPEDEVERVQAKNAVYPHVGAKVGGMLEAWPLR